MLVFAIYRLAPIALDLERSPMSQLHWAALIVSVAYMAYAEGYKGFHLGFAPRVVIRASYLRDNPRLSHILLAPLFCMGYIYATRKRKLFSIGLTITIGIASILYFVVVENRNPELIKISPEVPGDI